MPGGLTAASGRFRESAVFEYFMDCGEIEILKQAPESRERTIDADVGPEPGQRGRLCDPRCLRVELPWVDVEYERLSKPLDGSERRSGDEIGQEPEVAAARNRQVDLADPERRDGKLDHGAVPEPVRNTRSVGNAVVVVIDGENA